MLKLEVGHNYLMDMGLRKDCAKVGVGSGTGWVCEGGNSLVEVGYNVNDGMKCQLDGGVGDVSAGTRGSGCGGVQGGVGQRVAGVCVWGGREGVNCWGVS